ncbi:MAG: hypothetical protein M1834_001963 [Cirrosporium novae-zelandiae]|nr:MAG: hypothetical protein M1834_001963 [Cirrosporium novae-zelandiae]
MATSTPTSTPLSALSFSRLTKTLKTTLDPIPEASDPSIALKNTTTSHMISATWTLTSGWSALSLHPTASVFHYATTYFEGLKCYRSPYDGHVRLFRPLLNYQRMQKSAARVALPADFEPEEFLKLITELVATDTPRWLPKTGTRKFLYIRPTLIGSGAGLGVDAPKEATLFIILTLIP